MITISDFSIDRPKPMTHGDSSSWPIPQGEEYRVVWLMSSVWVTAYNINVGTVSN